MTLLKKMGSTNWAFDYVKNMALKREGGGFGITNFSKKYKNAEFVELCIVITTSGFFPLKSKVFCESFLCVRYNFSRAKIGFYNYFFTFLKPTLKYS